MTSNVVRSLTAAGLVAFATAGVALGVCSDKQPEKKHPTPTVVATATHTPTAQPTPVRPPIPPSVPTAMPKLPDAGTGGFDPYAGCKDVMCP